MATSEQPTTPAIETPEQFAAAFDAVRRYARDQYDARPGKTALTVAAQLDALEPWARELVAELTRRV